ncbi:ABC transporter substrate-binding protein [Ideonella oryzae]|uniref:Extracellular solute-binding protein n=1 Tax=Ideonella oryzae TaxID=2937441 RepID=A0ABT1BM70_9BURK|nr:extracellular solute-binding protein [Ideonella oryzae]MCO5977319.1 extracellular solute-binding protein [Ideonella oryzae]
MTSTSRWTRRDWLRGLAAGLAGGTGWAQGAEPGAGIGAGTVVVLTSYAEELSVRYQALFERLHPGTRVEILWRQSADALAYLRRSRGEVDVYWAPAPGNFSALAGEGRFAPLQATRREGRALAHAVAGRPIDDLQGRYAAFELAGYGIAYHPAAVRRLGRPAPRDWADLVHPAYAGQIQIPIPGRIGFAPVLIETLLQGSGWDAGWALLAALGANADFGAASDASPGPDQVVSGARAARLTIDFFANQAIAGGAPLAFVYPRRTAYNPAQIGVLADAPHPVLAQAFAALCLSEPGQTLLLHPDVRRLPVRPGLYGAHPDLPARPFAPGNLAYDGSLTRERNGLVAALFDLALVQRHGEQAALWAALHRAEAARPGAGALREARALLSAPPVSQAQQDDPALRQRLAWPERRPGQDEPAPDPARGVLLAHWAADRDARLQAARQILAREPAAGLA